MLWEANIDIQYIGEYTMALDRYITGYITKPERNHTRDLWEQSNKNSSLRSQLKKYSLQCLKSREAGIYEVFDKILGYEMCEFSTKVTWVNTFSKEQRRKLLVPHKQLLQLDPKSKKVFRSNVLDDYYPNRPDILEEMCLFEFLALYDLKPEACSKSHVECTALKIDPSTNRPFGFIHKRAIEKILNMATIKPADAESTEAYFRQILFLFLPWRDEDSLKNGFATYHEAYTNSVDLAGQKLITFDIERLDRFQFVQKRTSIALEIAKRIREENSYNEVEFNNRAGPETVGAADFVLTTVDPNVLLTKLKALNKDQKYVFDKVINSIDHIEAHKSNLCTCNRPPRPIRFFCSGVAGN